MNNINFEFDTYLSDVYHLLITYKGNSDKNIDLQSIRKDLYYSFDDFDDFSFKYAIKRIRDLFYGVDEKLLFISVVNRDVPDNYALVRYEDNLLVSYKNYHDGKYVSYSLNDHFDCNFSLHDFDISYFYEISDLLSIKGEDHMNSTKNKVRKSYRRYV